MTQRLSLYAVLLILCLALAQGCQPEATAPIVGNPPAEGFDIEGSDEKAIAIADEVMEAMGGRQAWEDAKVISWTFFGSRKHIWDKAGQRAKIENPRYQSTVILDLTTMDGVAYKEGAEVTEEEAKKALLKGGKEAWINDSYWLVMPFKLKDSGVTLKYVGQDTTTDGRSAEKLELTFDNVGVTPDNKYFVYVDDESNLVTQWDYYGSYMDTLPAFQSPWPDYQQYGPILLSGGQIGNRKLTDIKVMDEVPAGTFDGLE